MSSPHRQSLRVLATEPEPSPDAQSAGTGSVVPRGWVPRGYTREQYELIVSELAQRLARTHAHMCADHREVLPAAMPRERQLTGSELEDLAWRAYVLSGTTGWDLIRCRPEVLIAAWEWRSSPEQDAFVSLFSPAAAK